MVMAYMRAEGPMWGRLYALAGGARAAKWQHAGVRSVVGKFHGYTMPLDLANWSERLSWCLGRYHDLPIQLALQVVLRPGDCFVDIGANIGMLALLGHHLVGVHGRVIACEPNPRLRERIESLVRTNNLQRLQLVASALGELPAMAELSEYAGHTGWGSLAPRGPEGADKTATWNVPVVRGDDVLAAVPTSQPMVIKIDVEGFEVPVLRGLQQTLATHRPLVFVEVADAHQQRAGFSAAALRGLLERQGYRGFALGLRRHGLFGRRLQWLPLAADQAAEVDAVFVPSAGPMGERVPLPQ